MPKKARLTRADFKILGRPAMREHGQLFTLIGAAGPKAAGPKASCIVSKKVAARAVDRNLIKRRARPAMRVALSGVTAPLLLAFYAKKEARNAPSGAIAEDILALAKRFLARCKVSV